MWAQRSNVTVIKGGLEPSVQVCILMFLTLKQQQQKGNEDLDKELVSLVSSF